MSFLAAPVEPSHVSAWRAETPGWGRWPFEAANLPTVNIGPWGRDAHQIGERIHAGYAFGVVPELAWRVAMGVVKEG